MIYYIIYVYGAYGDRDICFMASYKELKRVFAVTIWEEKPDA